ncbi:hypothetical protein V8C37DRAFT_395737 [Trichoderma ceciliae]
MRLFDAVRGGSLRVPPHIIDLEKRLKKEWTKRDREDKKATKAPGSAVTAQAGSSQKASTGKGKADVTVTVTINANVPGDTTPTAPTPTNAAKKAKLSASSERSSPERRHTVRPTARRGGSSRTPSRQESAARASPAPVLLTRQLAGRAARRSRPFTPQGRIQSSQFQRGGYSDSADPFDEPPPPYGEYHEGNSQSGETANLAPLGLLNGRYDISCPYVDSEWPSYGAEFSLVLTLAGSNLWGRLDLGVIEGVMYFDQRPRSSSFDEVPFHWRGREDDGPILSSDENITGWIRFLGDGRIEGWIDYQGIHFTGHRLPHQGTRSEIDARTLQNEWREYSEDEYERLNQARWG